MISHSHETQNEKFKMQASLNKMALLISLVGLLALIVGFVMDPQKTWGTFLVNGYYFSGLALSGLFILSLHYLTGSDWFEALRKLPEVISSFLPWAFILFLPIYFGMPSLYHWTDPHAAHDPLLAARSGYMNEVGFMIRMCIYFGLWIIFALAFQRNSKSETPLDCARSRKRNKILAAIFMIVFAYSFSLATVDWVMSIEPHWYSTVFGLYAFSGVFLNGMVVVTIMLILLKKRGYFQMIGEAHMHDLGKYLFSFSCFWAYIWFCQYVLIWYGNIPEETVYYKIRTAQDWDWLFYFNFFINFVLPFFSLISRNAKRNTEHLLRIASVMLIGHWLDLYLLIMPGLHLKNASIGFVEILSALGFAGLFVYVVGARLNDKKLYPVASTHLTQSFHHHHS